MYKSRPHINAGAVDIQLVKQLKNIFAKYSCIRLAILFGSLAKGNARPDSDIDVAIHAGRPINVDEKIQLIEELAEVTGRPVDLVDLCAVGEPLLGQIITGGYRLIGENAEFAKLLVKHLFDQADFLPYRNRILNERRRKWIGN